MSETNIVPDITLPEYYMGRDKLYAEELSDAHKMNANKTVELANKALERFGQKRRLVSGWRPGAINKATKGAKPDSKHVLCQAIDIEDINRELTNWCLNNPDILAELGLWMEDPRDATTWVHWQTVPPTSSKRIFRA